ncbi:MAG: hypothetical protein ACK4OE_22610 [Acidovorax sp.]|uniref:hypothetical protein n=1 Tax=Acidovorax sp. TaxID=1872122 RepID=UPI00391BE018
MPIPLVPIIAALAAGGTLVPHAAGGLIVTAAAGGGYVAGTYLSTAAVASVLVGGVAALGTGVAVATGAASAVIGGAGVFGTTIGATGLTGALMSAGIISATPIWVPIAIGGGIIGIIAGAYKLYKLKKKLRETPHGEEAHFTESEARAVERVIRLAVKYNGFKPEA